MAKLVSIVGPSGVGKTSLVRALCAASPDLIPAYEQHAERPFQALFAQDRRYALANQVDYLLARAEQERSLRASNDTVLMDGGLEMDFYGFTRLFHQRGFLSDKEFDLCRRLYETLRTAFPPPDLFLRLTANPEVVSARLAGRERINIAQADDSALLDSFLDEWQAASPVDVFITHDVSSSEASYPEAPELTAQIHTKLSRIYQQKVSSQ
jgi:deoxyadenosine/deoxycytidine kinase